MPYGIQHVMSISCVENVMFPQVNGKHDHATLLYLQKSPETEKLSSALFGQLAR